MSVALSSCSRQTILIVFSLSNPCRCRSRRCEAVSLSQCTPINGTQSFCSSRDPHKMSASITAVALSLLALSSASPISNPISKRAATVADASAAYTTLQAWYNEGSGLWNPSTGWWNSANCLTVVANLALVESSFRNTAEAIFANTFTNAPSNNVQMAKVMGLQGNEFLTTTVYTNSSFPAVSGSSISEAVLNMQSTETTTTNGWWALAWIAAYDVSGNSQYLSEAEYIYNDMRETFGQTPCSSNSGGSGGIWWDKDHTYVNAIANELFLSVAAHLANRASGSKAAGYLSDAKQQWAWFQGSGMINSNNNINDGLSSGCDNNGGTVWSYNQGVVLGGLSELHLATSDYSYISSAQNIANAAISTLSQNGILHDPCEPNCGLDGSQFKGVLMRNMMELYVVDSSQGQYQTYLQDNAASILQSDNENSKLGLVWSGSFVGPANASTQSSAMDAIVGSITVS
ncbi:hypothetical protein MRB53_039684 [Persea americana]|nr:hypothetical protein MRB53_039684 [Persea americana]